MLVAYLYLLWF